MLAQIIRRRPSGGRGRSTAGLPPRAPAAASVAGRDRMVAYACSTAAGSTSSSGTPSTTYTSSRGSGLSFDELRLQLLLIDDEEKARRRERTRHLVNEFCHSNGDMAAALERWLSDMGISWVLDLADDPSAVTSLLLQAQPQRDNLTERWIWALTEITDANHLDEYIVRPGRVQLFRIVEATVVKMLPFVDALLAAADLDASNVVQAPSEKLQALLCVRDALSSATGGIRSCFGGKCSVPLEMEAQRISKLLSLLLEKDHRFDEAIWNTIEEVRTGILNEDDNEWGIQTSQGSPDICKVTRSFETYIRYLCTNYWRLNCIVRAAAERGSYVPNRNMISSFLISAEQEDKASSPLTTLALEMVSSLQVELAKRSKSFPDHSLRFLFLINNTHFIQQQLYPFFTKIYKDVLGLKIDYYIQQYLQESWVPVMLCLYNHTRRWFIKNFALPKFELEFRKTYIVHKLWKVPDPELRTRLRTVIVGQVVTGLTGFLEVYKVTSPGITPQEREKMLLELFEG